MAGNSAEKLSERMLLAEIDYSELIGRKVECIPGCGLCCLCQPEVLQDETSFFRKTHPTALVRNRYPEDHLALALKKGRGSCVFLGDRRCTVYERRPAYCRQFPYHFHVGERIKIELDLSCRGVWTGNGVNATDDVRPILNAAERRLMDALAEASAVYQEFYANCREAGVMGDPKRIRASVGRRIPEFTDLRFIGKVMEMSFEDPVMDLDAVTAGEIDMDELEGAARDAALGSMMSADPVSVPVYCDGEWNWNIFMASGRRMEWKVIDDDGDIHEKGSADPADIRLVPPEPSGGVLLQEYIKILNQRDSMLGNTFYMMDEWGYEDDMSNTYFGAMSVTILDLMWRSSMLTHFMGTGTGASGIREAIIFYDMDRLDAPTIGAFV
jgi:Fe-S-cluster containining protein